MKINNLEWRRQVFHLLLGVVLVILLMFGAIDENFILVMTLIGLLTSFIIRKNRTSIIWDILKKFERKDELYEFPKKAQYSISLVFMFHCFCFKRNSNGIHHGACFW